MKLFIIILTFIWVGLLIGISFLEAPLKFQAPNITLELGLGIGQLVFQALNKIELFISVSIVILLGVLKLPLKHWIIYLIPIVILIYQTVFLLPVLDERANQVLIGNPIPKTYHHWAYIIAEIIKLITLVIAGVIFFKKTTNEVRYKEH